jgi:fumarate hydratase, class II
MNEYRIEEDSMGKVLIPVDALYGAQTQRAIDNFSVSGQRMPSRFIRVLALIKGCAALTNRELGLLDQDIADAIDAAANEVAEGKWDDQFPVDIFQTGSGTSTNMNLNEVIANRAAGILGFEAGAKKVHPNDHVNLCQSSNDVIPTAIHLCGLIAIKEVLLPGLSHLHSRLAERAEESKCLVKTGRTHLMDAVPLLLSQEIGAWAYQISQCIERVESCIPRLSRLALGGTAVGTGLNAHQGFAGQTIERLSKKTGFSFSETDNHFAAQASMDNIVELSGHLKTAAAALMKISNDLRWMNSGPVAGLAEISLLARQPGSSIMPGKVNPVICESVLMACAQVIGNDAAITACANLGNFELNTGLPLIAYDILQSINIMGNASRMLADKTVAGFTVNENHISELLGRNPVLVTALTPKIGYDKAAQIVKKAIYEKRPILEIAKEELNIPEEELKHLLDPLKMVEKGTFG